MLQSDPLWKRFSDSSKEALRRAGEIAGMESRKISPRHLLFGVGQTHGTDSPVLVLLKHFNRLENDFYDALEFDPNQGANLVGSSAVKQATIPDDKLLEEGLYEPDAYRIIFTSLELADKYNRVDTPPLVRLDELFGAILADKTEAQGILRRLLAPAWVGYEEIEAAYFEYMDEPVGLHLDEFLDQRLPPPSNALQRAISGFGADTRAKNDLVGIGAEIDAFAYLLTARALQPPLAIGLFGDWGSGKTYFMQSLKERVYKITEGARQSGKAQKDISVFKYVVQIEFNAWHYVEGELWASLVEHIFNNLQTREKERQTLLEERHQEWAKKIDIKRREHREIQKRKKELSGKLRRKRSQVENLLKARDTKRKDLNDLKATDVLQAVDLETEDKKKINSLLKSMGITPAAQSGVDFYNALNELKDVLEETNTLGLLLRRRGLGWTLGLILVLLSGPLISLCLNNIEQIQIPVVTNGLLGLSGFLSAATVLLRFSTNSISSINQKIHSAQIKLDKKRDEIEKEFASQIEKIEEEITPIEEKFMKAQQEERELVDRISALEKEAEEITPNRVLLEFIKNRVSSQDYRQWLGVPALIRRDFDTLSNLIMETNEKFIEEDSGSIPDDTSHDINRIILYIDDLDRCPPDKVTKVLQAVHLLLAFPLFVVVVAVDARWLSQSLQTYYEGLLSSSANQIKEDEDGSPRATPDDYLEKIFQVPFWIKPLTESARLSMVSGLVSESLKQLNIVEEKFQEKDGNLKKPGSILNPDEATAALVESEIPEQIRYISEPKESLSVNPAGLEIEPQELKFMKSLKSVLGLTPRSVRRFVNVYWLLKSIALTNPETKDFINQEDFANYKQVLFLLAVLTGLPSLAHDFFAMLCPQPVKGFEEAKCPYDTLEDIVAALQDLLTDRQTRGFDTLNAKRDLDRLELWVTAEENKNWLSVPTEVLGAWAPKVARFSYRMEMV